MSAQDTPEEQTLLLEYDLTELPTAQHKAGLAGLLLHLQSLDERNVPDAPVAERLEPLGASIRISRKSLQVLFDDLYSGAPEDNWVRSKYGSKPPLDEKTEMIERGGKQEKIKLYLYRDLRPQCEVIAHWRPEGKGDPWFRLWQSMLWGVLRAQPRTRGEFQRRADGDGVGFTDKLWRSLTKAEAGRSKGKFVVESIAGSMFIGAQDKNAERVDFSGRVEHNLLLHFWPWAAPLFVPRVIDPRKGSWDFQGFLLAIPEVADLDEFTEEMKLYWQGLDAEKMGYRPAAALVDLPEEGGLEFLHHLARHRVGKSDITYSIHAVELYHQHKLGNNVRQLAAERLAPSPELIANYERIRGDRKKHPLFKRLQIRNLVHGRPWYTGADDLFERFAAEIFVHGAETPKGRFFGTDVRRQFDAAIDEIPAEETLMSEEDRDKVLQGLIYRVVSTYVDKRTRDRAGITEQCKFNQLKGSQQRDYREVKPKVAINAFLALRARREQEVAEYVTGTLCAVGCYLPEKDFLILADYLLNESAKVKTLAMLALSAHSWTRSTDNDTQAEEADQNAATTD